MKKTVYFETLGCPKNVYDSSYAAGILEKAGYAEVHDPAEADFIVVNTCGFIEDAKRESIETILEMAEYKSGGRVLVATGCLTQRYGDELVRELPEIDAYLGVGEYERLPDVLDGFLQTSVSVLESGMVSGRRGMVSGRREIRGDGEFERGDKDNSGNEFERGDKDNSGNEFERGDKGDSGDEFDRGDISGDLPIGIRGGYSYLKIADGCDNRCAYCIIPYIRGPYKSRNMEDIVSEAGDLASAGAKEIILVAQDVTAYGIDVYGVYKLADLIRELCRIDGLRWLRLMYCYEDRITDDLIRVMAEEEKVCHYIDLPLQHASDKILKAMGRRSTKAGILDTVGRLRAAMPDISIRTTFITGFPGETRAEFDELMRFLEEVRFNRLGVFTYSREEGTPAAVMSGQVRRDVKARRLDGLMRLQQGISLALNEGLVGLTVEVLIEEEREDGCFFGRTQYDAPEVDNGIMVNRGDYAGEVKPGDMVRVLVMAASDYDLYGEIRY